MFAAGPEVLPQTARHERIARRGAWRGDAVHRPAAVRDPRVPGGEGLAVALARLPARTAARHATKGGIWPALIGTIYLVGVSLAVAAPVGVLAAVYLNEYARDNWFTRLIHLAVVNLAGVPSIVHALFGLGAFVLAAGLGQSILAASLTLAIMTLPVIIASTREALAAVPAVLPRGLLERRRHALADDPRRRAAQLDQRHPDRRDPAGLARGRRDGADPVHGRGLLQGRRPGRSVPVPAHRERMALSMHLYTLATQVNDAPDSLQYATATVLVGAVLLINSTAIALRAVLRSRKKW